MRSLPSVMNSSQHFARVPSANIPRSKFDRSHGLKTTFDAGYLIPVFLDEALPGDTFNLSMTGFARLATPLFPYMDNVFVDSFFFAVPYRLVWELWQEFNGEQLDPDSSTDYVIPTLNYPAVTGFEENTLHDYLGLPTKVIPAGGSQGPLISALYHRAYNLIWNEWFRDQNLQDSVPVNYASNGPDQISDYVLLKRGKRHDYFTSALPWPQKGPSVELPLGSSANILLNTSVTDKAVIFKKYNDHTLSNTNAADEAIRIAGSTDPSTTFPSALYNSTNDTYGVIDPNGTLYADLTTATASTINALREAFQIQKLYERDARGGTRYTEIIRSHFGVVSPDARLQRPEYLGGGSTTVNVTPVAQTSSTASEPSPQGNLAAFATATLRNNGFSKSFTEHSIVIGLVAVRADLNYQQGLNKMFTRSTRFDFYWPALSHIGEQAVLNQEIFQGTSDAVNQDVFGYQERYAEYRYKPSLITGNFRSNHTDSLDAWHLAIDFATLPELNADFIQEDPPIDRIKALGDDYPDFIFDSYFKYTCARPMPTYAVPGLIDHF